MEIISWISQATIPLLGWWLLTTSFQKLGTHFQQNWKWNQNFKSDFLRSLLVTFCHVTSENHGDVLEKSPLSIRLRLLWLGLRSLSFGFIFLMTFGTWNIVPVSVFTILGLMIFLAAQWWKPLRDWALFALGVALFLYGFEWLFQASSQMIRNVEEDTWVFALSHNYLLGALIGFALGGIVRLVTRMSGVAWWMGAHGLLAGILSLGGAWGFFLGDFIVGLVEDFFRHRKPDFRLRIYLGLTLGVFGLLFTTVIQNFVMLWINGQYSVQLRSLQFAAMVFLFLLLESVVALTFFHFYFLKVQKNPEGRSARAT
jgi:Na+/phosphate symporter